MKALLQSVCGVRGGGGSGGYGGGGGGAKRLGWNERWLVRTFVSGW